MKNYKLYLSCILFSCFTYSIISGNDALLWKFETSGRVVAEPVIRNDSLFIGSLDSSFYVIDALNGTELWHYETGNEIRTTAALYEGNICFESGNVLYGLNLAGELLWTDTLYDGQVTNQHDTWDVFRSSPTLHDSIAYIGSEEGLVIGVNVKNGERVFEAQTPQGDASIETPPAIYGNTIYVGDWLGVLSAFDLTSQQLAWQYDTKDDNTYSWVNAIVAKPLIYQDTLYFGGRSCNLYALNPETGDKLWMYHNPEDKWLFGGPVVHNDTLYVGSSYQQDLYAFNPHQPELYWSSFVYGLNYGNPAPIDDLVIIGTGGTGSSTSGSLTIVGKNSHEMKERFNVGGWVETPLYLDSKIYFGCADGGVYAIDADILLSTLRPDTKFKNEDLIDLGLQPAESTASTSFYVYNYGEGADSVINVTTSSNVSIEPANFSLPSMDSVQITATIDLSGLSSGSRQYDIKLSSLNSFLPSYYFMKRITLEIEEPDQLQGEFWKENFLPRLYPNPANESATIAFSLKEESFVDIKLFNSAGVCIKTIHYETMNAGEHFQQIHTEKLRSGLYFVSIQINQEILIEKLTIKE